VTKLSQAALGRVQAAFRENYARVRTATIARLKAGRPPVVIRIEEELILLDANGEHRFSFDTRTYEDMKQLSHLAPLLALAGDEACDLRAVAEAVDAAAALSVDDDADAYAIVSAARALSMGADGAIDPGRLAKFGKTVRPALEHAARRAAEADIAALAGAMRKVEKKLGLDVLRDAYFVICGAHQARRRELTRQFFERWLREAFGASDYVCHQLLYAEDRESVDGALELVATRLVDARIAERIFGDRTRLDEDVLGQAGAAVLAGMTSLR
jgi:hypothetical protein